MDVSDIMKILSGNQKNLLIACAIQFPIVASILYLSSPQYASMDIYVQCVMSISVSVLTTYLAYGIMAAVNVVFEDFSSDIPIVMIIFPVFCVGAKFLLSPDSMDIDSVRKWYIAYLVTLLFITSSVSYYFKYKKNNKRGNGDKSKEESDNVIEH